MIIHVNGIAFVGWLVARATVFVSQSHRNNEDQGHIIIIIIQYHHHIIIIHEGYQALQYLFFPPNFLSFFITIQSNFQPLTLLLTGDSWPMMGQYTHTQTHTHTHTHTHLYLILQLCPYIKVSPCMQLKLIIQISCNFLEQNNYAPLPIDPMKVDR